MSKLTVEKEAILLFAKVLDNHPWMAEPIIRDIYKYAIEEINMMTEDNKRSYIDEKIEMTKEIIN